MPPRSITDTLTVADLQHHDSYLLQAKPRHCRHWEARPLRYYALPQFRELDAERLRRGGAKPGSWAFVIGNREDRGAVSYSFPGV